MAEETDEIVDDKVSDDPLGLDKALKAKQAKSPAIPAGADPLGFDALLKKKGEENVYGTSAPSSPAASSSSLPVDEINQSRSGLDENLLPTNKETAIPFTAQDEKDKQVRQQSLESDYAHPGFRTVNTVPSNTSQSPKLSTEQMAEEAKPEAGYSPTSIVGQFNTGLAKVTDLGAGAFKLYDSLINTITPGSDNAKKNQYDTAWLFDWASKWLRSTGEEAPLPDTFGGKLVGGLAQTVPTLLGAAVTGGATAEGQAFSGIGDAAGGYLTKSQLVQNALTKAAGPLTQYLGLTGAGEGANEGYDQSKGRFLPTLLSTLKGGAKGIEEGVALEGQMGAGEVIGGNLMKLAIKTGVTNADGVITEQALKSLVGSPFAFAASSVSDDLANGRPIDWTNAGVSAATALPFEAEHLVGAKAKSDAIAEQKQQLTDHIDYATNVAGANSMLNFATAGPQDIEAALKRPESVDELQVLALGKGVQAQKATTLQDKNTLHMAQLELQKQADIKQVAQKVIDDGVAGFGTALNETQFPDQLKEKLLQQADFVNNTYNPKVVADRNVTENLKEVIDHTQAHIDALNEQHPAATIVDNPAAINSLIDMVEIRTDLQEKLLDHTENEIKPDEIKTDPYETELEKLGYDKKEIDTFNDEQKQHIVEHQVVNEAKQGTVPAADETPTNDKQAIGDVENGAVSTEEGLIPRTTTDEAHVSAEFNGDNSQNEERVSNPIGDPFTYQSKDHGLIDIQRYEDGKYKATFSDGSSELFTRAEMGDFFDVEPERFDKAETDNRLHATDHPEHVAQIYLDKLHELNDLGNPESAIAQYGPRVTPKHFADVNDKNNVSGPMRLNYFRTTQGKDTDLHDQAEEINNMFYGGAPRIHAEDIANFMIKYPNGEKTFFTPSGNEELRAIADRYQQLKGKKLSRAVAERVVAEAGKSGSADTEELRGEVNTKLINDILEETFNFEPNGITVEEWADKMRSQFDEYVKDPQEVFNIFHPVFDGLELTEDQINQVHEFITDRQNGQEPGGRSDDQLAEQPESTGVGTKDSASAAENTDKSEGAGAAETAEGTYAKTNLESETPITENDDVPFQKSEGEQLPAEKVKLAQGLIERAFPGINADFHEDVDSFKEALNKNHIEVHSDNLPNAFVGEDGTIHFNPEKINADTQLHEYGHILTSWAEKFAPKLYESMQRFGREATDVHQELKDNGYFLSGKRLNDEAFVTMLGREGAGRLEDAISNSGKRGVVKSFIKEVWDRFQRYLLEKTGFDISKFKNIKNMGVAEFMNTLNSKYLLSGTEVSKVSGEDLAAESRFQLKKPERNPGETMAEYARRLGEWKRDLYNNPGGRTRSDLNRFLAPVRQKLAELNRSFAEGVKKSKADTKTAFLEYDAYRKSIEKQKLSDLKERYEKKLAAEKEASGDKLDRLKAETKQAFLEYDAFQKGKTKERLTELRNKYNEKLTDEKRIRQEQTQALKDHYKNIRTEINGVLESLRKTGQLGGVKFSDKDVLAFANQVNRVTTERGLDRFKEFVVQASKSVDFLRDLTENRKLIKDAKALLKKEFVPPNIKSLIREITMLNPNRVENPKELKAILNDINDSQRAKEIPQRSETEINDFINKEREYDIRNRAVDVMNSRNDIENSPEHTAVAEQKGSSLPSDFDLRRDVEKIVRNPELTHNERVKRLNEFNDALSAYHADLWDTIDLLTNEVTREPENFDQILQELRTGDSSVDKESLRDKLEGIAKQKQDAIEIDPEMSPEQKQSLETLKDVPLTGEDSDTLRLFNNVLENILLNDNHGGIGVFEAKAIGNGKDGALKLVDYLEEKGTGSRNARFKTKVGQLRSLAAGVSVIMSRIANNDFEFLNKLNTGTYFDEMRNGFAKAHVRYNDLIATKLHAIFKENHDIANNPDAIVRLTLFSYLNQNREFSSPDQANKELVKRLTTIKKDIELKSAEGLHVDNGEAEIERRVFDEMAGKIKDATGIDVNDKLQLSGLKYSDIKDIAFLGDGEKKVYDAFRSADDILLPEHREVVERQLNQPYETWNNHMRDGYRFLGSGLVDVVTGDNLGFTATSSNTADGSSTSIQRVKGDPIATKAGDKQRVINMNFFDVQNQNIQNMLEDIHTLKSRQIFDTAIKNRDLRDALGNENHQLYKNTVKDFVLNSMGLNNAMNAKELKILKQGINFITKAGTFKQLLSLSAYLKQGAATVFNTLVTTGLDGKLMYKTNQLMGSEAMNKLIADHPIGQRADNLASLNILRMEGSGDVNNIVDSHTKAAANFFNRYFQHLEKNGANEEKWITKPIKWGDVKSGEWAWATYYAKHIMDTEGKKFEDIDWAKEAAKPNRNAAEYAENMTSKQLNENTKAGRSKLINSNDIFYQSIKAFMLPFGSFNLHKMQTLVENFRTLASKNTFVDADYRKNEAKNAGMSLIGGLAEESAFQGLKIALGYGLTAFVTKGLAWALTSIFADDKEKAEVLGKIDEKLAKKKDEAFQQWYTNTLGNYFFGGLGNLPQDQSQRAINSLTNSDFFYEPNISPTQQVNDANNYGMYGAAFSGNKDLMKDVFRSFIDNSDKYGVDVKITPYQKAVVATSFLSNILAMSGLNDADLNRSVESMRKQVEFGLASKFHEPNYEDISKPSPLKIGNKVVTLSDEHLKFYEQTKENYRNKLMSKGVDSKAAATRASKVAKAKLLEKYGYDTVIKEGAVRKK